MRMDSETLIDAFTKASLVLEQAPSPRPLTGLGTSLEIKVLAAEQVAALYAHSWGRQ